MKPRLDKGISPGVVIGLRHDLHGDLHAARSGLRRVPPGCGSASAGRTVHAEQWAGTPAVFVAVLADRVPRRGACPGSRPYRWALPDVMALALHQDTRPQT